MKTNIRVNNTTHELSLDSRLTLLDALRDVLGVGVHRHDVFSQRRGNEAFNRDDVLAVARCR